MCVQHLKYSLSLAFFLVQPLQAQQQELPEKWLADKMTNCKLLVAGRAKRLIYKGDCENGLAEGYGDVEIYKKPIGRERYDGGFTSGLHIGETYTKGEIFEVANTYYFTLAPDKSFYTIIQPKSENTVLCSGQAAMGVEGSNVEVAAKSLGAQYNTVCQERSNTTSQLFVQLLDKKALDKGQQLVTGSLMLNLNGDQWAVSDLQITQPTRTVKNPQQQPPDELQIEQTSAPVKLVRQPVKEVASSTPLNLTLYSEVIGKKQPRCKLNLSFHNTGVNTIGSFSTTGNLLNRNGNILTPFQLSSKAMLPEGSRHKMTKVLPFEFCKPYGQPAQLAEKVNFQQLTCRNASGQTISCFDKIRLIPLPQNLRQTQTALFVMQ